METEAQDGFRLRMAVFAAMVNEMIIAQLAEEAQTSTTRPSPSPCISYACRDSFAAELNINNSTSRQATGAKLRCG